MRDEPVRALTPKQTQVAVCVARGMTYPEIARTLSMSERTAHTHVYNIARLLPTIAGLLPYRRVFLWMHAETIEHASEKAA